MTDENDAQDGHLSILESVPTLSPDLSRGLGSEAHQVGSQGIVDKPHACKAQISTIKSNTNKSTITHNQLNTALTLSTRYPKITVRIPSTLLTTLKTYAHQQGYRLANLIRTLLSEKELPKPIYSIEESRAHSKELRQLSVDVNRIALAIDSGMREGHNVYFQRFEEAFLMDVDPVIWTLLIQT